jgi:hypothetical protein
MSMQIFVTLSAIFVKNLMINLRGQNHSFYQYKQDFSCYLMILGGNKFVSFVLNHHDKKNSPIDFQGQR